MGKHVVFDDNDKMKNDLASAVGKLEEALKMPVGLDFKVEVEMPPELEKAMGKDPLLLQKMHDAVKPIYKKLIDSLARDVKSSRVEQDVGRAPGRDEGALEEVKKLPNKLKSLVDGQMGVASNNAQKDALALLRSCCKPTARCLQPDDQR